MKRLLLACIMSCTLAALAPAQGPRPGEIQVIFSETDIAQVLRAISLKTGASIVYSGKKIPVTLNVRAANVEDAVRSAASAAGLAYRRIDGTFVVAESTQMRQALSPYAETAYFQLADGMAAKLQPTLEQLFPDATVRVVGSRLQVKAIPRDLMDVRQAVDDLVAYEERRKPVVETITLTQGAPGEIAKAVTAVVTGVSATPGGLNGSEGGTLVLTGPNDQVKIASDLARKLDIPAMGDGQSRVTFTVKELKYASPTAVMEFLKKAAPEVEALIGPNSVVPDRPIFAPLSATMQQSITGGGGLGGLGGGFGGANNPQNIQGNGQGVSQANLEKSKRIVLKGPAGAIAEAVRLIESIDLKPAQVVVEVRVVETSNTFSENIGIRYGWTSFKFFEAAPGTAITGPGIELESYPTKPAGFGQFSRAPWTFEATLNALIADGTAKVLANPTVQVIDNEDANVFIGNTIRARIAQAGSLGAQTIEIREFPVGIVLLIRPRVNGSESITMQVNPVVSTVTGLTADNVPQTSTREAQTTVIVRDGETMVIGGLIRDEYTKVVSEVPFLSKLPIIGELFKNRTTQKNRTEVLVTITPRIVKDTPSGS